MVIMRHGFSASGHTQVINKNSDNKLPLLLLVTAFLYFLLSGVTYTADPSAGAIGRLIAADFFMVILAGATVLYLKRIYIVADFFYLLPFILVSGIACLMSAVPEKAFVELLVHIWAWLGGVLVFNLMATRPSTSVSPILEALLLSTTVLAILGLVQFFFIQNLFAGLTIGGVVGTFRNTGQFGSYMGMGLAVLIPGLISKLIKPSALKWGMVFVIILSLLFSTKRAALIGFIIGYGGLIIVLMFGGNARYRRASIYLFSISIPVLAITYLGLEWGKGNLIGVSYRLDKKVNANTFERFFDGFFRENMEASFLAFSDKPFFGVGMGNVAKIYTAKYEIHSTYLKVLATGGVIGVGAYCYFMFSWVRGVFKGRLIESKEGVFLLYFTPFLTGLVVSWTYTYHLRKREFWICFAIVVFISRIAYLKQKYNIQDKV